MNPPIAGPRGTTRSSTVDELVDGAAAGANRPAKSVPPPIDSLRSSARHQPMNLSADESSFWTAHSGASSEIDGIRRASLRNSSRAERMAATALTELQVAERLNITPAAVRRYEDEHRIFAYKYAGSILYPLWQFIKPNKGLLPGLHKILRTIPDGMHPQVVTGFFESTNPELIINGIPVSVSTWLLSDGDIEVVIDMARSVGWTL